MPSPIDVLIRDLTTGSIEPTASFVRSLLIAYDDEEGTSETGMAKKNTIGALLDLAYALRGLLTASNLTMNAARLAGRITAGAGAIEEIQIADGLFFQAGALKAEATQAKLDLKANLASPALTGVPTAPTAAPGTNTTQLANTAFVAAAVTNALVSVMKHKGDIACSTNPNYPAAVVGDVYLVTSAGRIGGAGGVQVEVGDSIICKANSAAGTHAAVGENWYRLEANIPGLASFGQSLIRCVNATDVNALLGTRMIRANATVNGYLTPAVPETPAEPPPALHIAFAGVEAGALAITYINDTTTVSAEVYFGSGLSGAGYVDTDLLSTGDDMASSLVTELNEIGSFGALVITQTGGVVTITASAVGTSVSLQAVKNSGLIDAVISGGGAGTDYAEGSPATGATITQNLFAYAPAVGVVRMWAVRNPEKGPITKQFQVMTGGGALLWNIPLGSWGTTEWFPSLGNTLAMNAGGNWRLELQDGEEVPEGEQITVYVIVEKI